MRLFNKSKLNISLKSTSFSWKLGVWLLVIVTNSCSIWQEYQYQKGIEGPQKAQTQIEKTLKNKPNDLLWLQRKWLMNFERPSTSLPHLFERYLAYGNWLSAFEKATLDDKKRVLSKGKKPEFIRNKQLESLNELLYWGYKTQNLDSLQWVINRIPDFKQKEAYLVLRDSLAFEKAKAIGTVEAFQHFAKAYPESKQNKMAQFTGSRKFFLDKTSSKTNETYQKFLAENPNHPFAEEAKSILTERILGLGFELNALNLLAEPWISNKEKQIAQSISDAFKAVKKETEVKLIPINDSLFWVNEKGIVVGLIDNLTDTISSFFFKKPLYLIPSSNLCNQAIMLLNADSKFIGFGTYENTIGNKIRNWDGTVLQLDSSLENPYFLGPNTIIATQKGKKGLFRIDGKSFLAPEWDELIPAKTIAPPFSDWLIAKKANKYTFISLADINTKIKEGQIYSLEPFWIDEFPEWIENSGYFEVKVNGLLGYLNPNKGWVLKPEWENHFRISNDLLISQKNGSFYFTNSKGKRLKEEGFQVWKENGPFLVWQYQGLWGLMDKKGQEILPPKFDSVFALNDQTILLRSSGNWQLQTADGNRLLLPPFLNIRQLNIYGTDNNPNTLMPWYEVTDLLGKRTILNNKGLRAFNLQAQDYKLLSKSFWALQIGSKWGIYKSQKGWVVKPKLLNIGALYLERYLSVIENSTFNLLDLTTGKKVFKNNFGTEVQPLTASDVTFFKVQSGVGFNLADSKGQLLFPNESFDRIISVNDTLIELEKSRIKLFYSLKSFERVSPWIKPLPILQAAQYSYDSTVWKSGSFNSFGLWDLKTQKPISQEIWSEYTLPKSEKFSFLYIYNDGSKMAFFEPEGRVYKQSKAKTEIGKLRLKKFLNIVDVDWEESTSEQSEP